MSAPVRILHFDDNPSDAQLIAFTLEIEQEKFPTTLTFVQTREEFLAALGRKDFDIILSDYRMPGYDGDQALKAAQEICPEIPFIMVTGELGEELVIETLKRGATDYVLKDRIFRLIPAVERALAEAENQRQRREDELKRKEAEARLAAALQQTSETLESIQDAFYGVDSQWRLTYVNARAELLLGKSRAELLGRNLWETFPQAVGTESERHLHTVMQERIPVQFETRSAVIKDWIEVQAFPKTDGGVSVLYRNIAERKIGEETIRQQATLIDLVPDAVIVRAMEGTVRFWNKGAEALYGWPEGEALGKNTHELLHTQISDAFAENIRTLTEQGVWEGELVQFTRAGKQLVVQSRWTAQQQPLLGAVILESNVDITARKETEERLRLALKVSDLGTFDLDITTGVAVHSPRHDQCFGYAEPLTEWTFELATRHILPEDLPLVLDAHARAEKTGVLDFEARVVWADGSIHWIAPRGIVHYDSQGRATRLIGVVADITQRKRTEDALRESEALARNRLQELEAIYKTAPVGLCLLDRNLRWLRINDKLAEINGIPAQAHIGKTPRELIPDFGEQAEAAMQRVLETGQPILNIELTGTTPSQPDVLRSFSEQWIPWKDEQGTIIGISVAAEETTERKRTEAALKESQTRLQRAHQETREILESIQDPFYVVDSAWRITYINGKALELWGKSREEVLSKVVWDLYPEATRQEAYNILQGAMHKRESVTFENWAPSFKHWVEVRAYPTEGGGLTLNYPDITDRKRAQERIEDLARFPGENPSPILRLRSDGVLLYANPASTPLLSAWKAVVGEEAPVALQELVSRLGTEHMGQGIDVPAADRIYAFLSARVPERGYVNLYGRDVTERKEMEAALREGEERFRTMADRIPQLAWMTDATGWIFWYNQRWFDYTGTTMEEMEGWGWQQVHHPEHVERVTAKFRRALVDGQSWEDTFPLRGKDGHYRWFLSRAFPITNADGQITRWFGTNTDITEQLRAEEALRETNKRLKESEELSRLALAAGRAGVWSWDVKTGTLQWSDEFYRIFGIEPGTIEPRAEEGLLRTHPEDRSHVTALIEKALASDEAIDETHRVLWPDGSVHWVRGMAKAFFDVPSDSKPRRLVGLALDVTVQKEIEQQLQRKNRELDAERLKWQQLIEGIADEVWACNVEGKVSMVKFAPKAGTAATELEEEVLTGLLREREVLRPDGSVRPDEESPLQRSLKGEIVRGEEIVRNRLTGETRIRQHSSVPVRDDEGGIAGAAAIVRDITEARQAESEIRKLNEELEERVKQRTAALERANKELESFSYSVSHDLKAPLRLIGGFAALIPRQGEVNLTVKQQESLATIQEQAARMDELIMALLEFSRITRQKPKLEPVNLRQMVEKAVIEQRQLLGEAGQRVRVEIGDLPIVQADSVLLLMVFTNLLSNAFKFTRTAAEPKIKIEATAESGFFQFRIADNGVGFPKGQTEKLFKVFQRLHAASEFEGSGIGLANVRKIIERHGGQVCGEGEEGKGATIYFTLPRTE